MKKVNFLEYENYEAPDDVSVGSQEDREKGISDLKKGGAFRNFVIQQSMILKKNTFNKGIDFLNLQIDGQFLYP